MAIYKLFPAAETDLAAIWLYTVEEWGLRQADDYIDQLADAFQLVADQPLICHERTEFSPPVRIFHQAHHLIVYRIEVDTIWVIRVLHESMDVDARLLNDS